MLEFLEDPQKAGFDDRPVAYRISSAHEHDGRLWLGALVANFVSYVDLRYLPPKPERIPLNWKPKLKCFTAPCDKAQRAFGGFSQQ